MWFKQGTCLNNHETSPSHHHFYRWYVYHSQMGGLWHCFNHNNHFRSEQWRHVNWGSFKSCDSLIFCKSHSKSQDIALQYYTFSRSVSIYTMIHAYAGPNKYVSSAVLQKSAVSYQEALKESLAAENHGQGSWRKSSGAANLLNIYLCTFLLCISSGHQF